MASQTLPRANWVTAKHSERTRDDEPAELCPYCQTTDCEQSPVFAADKTARIAELESSIAALGNAGKAERERWVVREMLLNLGTHFNDAELLSVPKQHEPPDVLFELARFEVKEVYDEGRRRGSDYTRQLSDARLASRCPELWPPDHHTPRDTTLSEVLQLAITVGEGHSRRYDAKLVPTLDLLLYHNLVGVYGMPNGPFPDAGRLSAQGWRSVSVLFGHRTIVFCASADAPAWLRGAVGTIMHRD